jgi:hypothetical protein
MLGCDCDYPAVAVAFQHADLVFAGKAAKVQDLGKNIDSSHRVVVTFQVDRSWKGAVHKVMVMHTRINTADCDGFVFTEGKQYIVYGYRRENWNFKDIVPKASKVLGTGLCSRTRQIEFAGEDLKILGTAGSPR